MGARLAKENEQYLKTGSKYDIYSDFNHTFIPHPNTGQITRRVNIESVKLALRNLLLTNKYERLRNPDFGGNIRRWLFEPFNQNTRVEIEDEIKNMVRNYEPRVRLLEVIVTDDVDNNAVNVRITFNVLTSIDKEEVELTLYRVR